jgi:hypothetical protein
MNKSKTKVAQKDYRKVTYAAAIESRAKKIQDAIADKAFEMGLYQIHKIRSICDDLEAELRLELPAVAEFSHPPDDKEAEDG